jgi:hypothetical protein
MELQNILEEILSNGYYEKDDLKLIYNLDVYYKEYEKIVKGSIPSEYKQSFQFAVFRGNLYNFNLYSSLDNDYKLYCDYVYNKRLVNLQLSTILLAKNLIVQYSTNLIKNQFDKEMQDYQNMLIINSFHYSASKLIMLYFLINNCDVYLIATPKVIKENEEKTNMFSALCHKLYATESLAYFMNAEDHLSLVKLYDIFSVKDNKRKKILLAFPDGNIGANRKNDENKNLFKVEFHNVKVHIRQGIFSFAKFFQSPIFNVIAESNKNSVTMKINDYYDFKTQNIDPDEFTSVLFQNFETFLIRENLSRWECMMYLHSWIDKREINKNKYVDKATFDINRYTYFKLDNQKYIFDSKYYLSLEVESDNIKKMVLNHSFYV